MNWTPVAIAIGSVLGALQRYYLTLFWAQRQGTQFPYGTLFVNLTGAVAIGAAVVFFEQWAVPIGLEKLLLVGFLGSYTTFSSYILESTSLLRWGDRRLGLLYWLGSPVLGFAGVEFGRWLAQRLV